MRNENIAYMVVGTVIIAVVIMLVISVFNNQSMTGHTVYVPESNVQKPVILQHYNYTFTIDCNTMDMPNIVLYFNSYNITEYHEMYDKYVAYDYTYDCDAQKLWLNVVGEEYTLVGIDLKIQR